MLHIVQHIETGTEDRSKKQRQEITQGRHSMQTGYLTIATYPDGAEIYIDNTLVLDEEGKPGLTPARLTITTGYHDIRLKLEGYCDEFDAQYIMQDANVDVFHDFNIC